MPAAKAGCKTQKAAITTRSNELARTGDLRCRNISLKRDAIRMNRHRALGCCLSMIFSENRCALFRIML
ncbi:hypothetical protein E4K66_16965 [Bradyrhizobium frederickii]|uniref:Uncharacterized protein n=1 Tax=Bradyrhizobium frederickii TaxID=2560054 RepID=A0A4Y9L5M1_9BRAD|nr:hypothetical protein E4K66_16965 [Bradyrhizobium frederickii]